jgi:protein-disulfide isomerase
MLSMWIRWRLLSWCLILMAFFPAVGAWGRIDWNIDQTLKIAQPFRDMTVSREGKWIFVLTCSGQVAVYNADGTLADTLDLGPHIDAITAGPREDQLLVHNSNDHTVQVISIEVVHDIPIGESPVEGDPAAPVTITVFADFQCPYCRQLNPLLDQVIEKNQGKVKLVFKQFPLKMHPFALEAALASEVAAKAGKFWDFHDLLFDNQNELSHKKILDVATDLGFDRAAFEKEMTDPDNYKRIEADIEEGVKAGVRGVPSVFINGKELKHRSLEGFQTLIDAALAAKNDLPSSR